MATFQQFGNDLYTGERSFGFVKRRMVWFGIALVAIIISIAAPFLRGGFELGIEFTGGSEFHIAAPATTDQTLATQVVSSYTQTPSRVQELGDGSMRVQTDTLTEEQNAQLRTELAEAYGTSVEQVGVSTIGPSWGADVTRQMGLGLLIFIGLAALLMSLYFRTWKMALAAVLALFHDLIITTGVYAIFGVEITPAAVIGLLTILGYSLYDTVVVFDKIRENTEDYSAEGSSTFGERVNLAINQTLVRSINTSVVAVLPVGAILFIGAFVLGAGTLKDISLALFIGMIVGAMSTIFLAGPIYATLRMRERGIRASDAKILERRALAAAAKDDDDSDDSEDAGETASAPAARA